MGDRAVLPASTRRGRSTREGLLAAARTVFERDGYVAARLTDIAGLAGVAHGTFYAHFRSKEEVFLAVMADLWSSLLVPAADDPGPGGGPYDRVLASNEHFLAGYRAHAQMFAVVEQAATVSAAVRERRRLVHAENAARVAKAIRRWQAEGVAATDVDPTEAATALVSMVGRAAYYWLVVGEPHDPATAAHTLSRLWTRGLGITEPKEVSPQWTST